MSILVIDIGTSSTRVSLTEPDGTVIRSATQATPPDIPFAGLVEFDAAAMADTTLSLAHQVLDGATAAAVGITNQRASVVVWDRQTGEPVGPGQGWQDLRTVGECMVLGAGGWRVAPNHSATKITNLLDSVDAHRTRDLVFGTVDTWLTWRLSEGAAHITDRSNASATLLLDVGAQDWDPSRFELLNIPQSAAPTLVASYGQLASATALPGAPMIASLSGDQSASLIGQACIEPGMAKATFGTGAMLDVMVGDERVVADVQSQNGTAPMVAWGDPEPRWMIEALMLAAGTNMAWLVEDLGILADPSEATDVAASVDSTEGVMYVPALNGLGTPRWDFGARGALVGLTRGTGRAHIVRAVLEGVAHRGADLVEAARADTGQPIDTLRVDGGMSVNPTFVQALADATGCTIELSPVVEGTTRGAALLAALGSDQLSDWSAVTDTWSARETITPAVDDDARSAERTRWSDAVDRAANWHGDLSAITF